MNKNNSAFYTLDDGDSFDCIGTIISQLQLETLLAYFLCGYPFSARV